MNIVEEKMIYWEMILEQGCISPLHTGSQVEKVLKTVSIIKRIAGSHSLLEVEEEAFTISQAKKAVLLQTKEVGN